MRDGGLYAIVDPAATGERDPERVAAAVLAGGCARLQLRWKDASDGERLRLARRLAEQCRLAGVPFVMNDRPDLAHLCGADGLHLGQGDLSVEDARKIVGETTEIGLSTHDVDQARRAAELGVDLLAFGPIYTTTSKLDPDPVVGIASLARICEGASRPVVAIGGVTLERAPAIREAGAAFGAAISAICAADDTESTARALHAALGGAR